jgi:hypothetical protein
LCEIFLTFAHRPTPPFDHSNFEFVSNFDRRPAAFGIHPSGFSMSLPHATLESLSASADRAQAQIDRALVNIEALPSVPDESLIRVRVDLLTDLSQNIFRLASVHKTIIALREALPGSVTSLRRLNRNIADLEHALAQLEGRTRSARARYTPSYSELNPPSLNALVPHARFPRDPDARVHTPFFAANPDLAALMNGTPDFVDASNSVDTPNFIDAPDFIEPLTPGDPTPAVAAAFSAASTLSTPVCDLLPALELDILAETRCVPLLPKLHAPDIADRLTAELDSVGRGSDPTLPTPSSVNHPNASADQPTASTPSAPIPAPAIATATGTPAPRALPLEPHTNSPFSDALRANLLPGIGSAVLGSAVPSSHLHPPPPG